MKKILQLAVEKLVAAYQREIIFLYGSFAWGNPTDDSDLDLLIVVDHSEEKPYKRMLKGLKALSGL